jgi:hypothetical protein
MDENLVNKLQDTFSNLGACPRSTHPSVFWLNVTPPIPSCSLRNWWHSAGGELYMSQLAVVRKSFQHFAPPLLRIPF